MEKVKRGEKCPHCGRYNSRNIVVDGIVVHDEKVLLIKRGIEPGKGQWALIGGYVDWDETLEEAVVREVKEEAGVDAVVNYRVGIYSKPTRKGVVNQNIAVAFALNTMSTEIYPQKSEVEGADWFDFASLPDNLAFDHRDMIEDFLRKEEKNG